MITTGHSGDIYNYWNTLSAFKMTICNYKNKLEEIYNGNK